MYAKKHSWIQIQKNVAFCGLQKKIEKIQVRFDNNIIKN